MRRLALAATCLVALAQATPALADVLYTNPPELGVNQNVSCLYNTVCSSADLIDGFAGQLFTLAQNSTITGAGFNSFVFGDFATAVHWIILDNDGAGGLPGTVLASGTSPVAHAPGPNGATWSTTDYSFDIPPLDLAAGDYYLAIQAVTDNFADFLSLGTASSGAVESDDGGSTWMFEYDQLELFPSVAVSVFGTVTAEQPIPEPATLALLGTGLLGLAAARRRRAG